MKASINGPAPYGLKSISLYKGRYPHVSSIDGDNVYINLGWDCVLLCDKKYLKEFVSMIRDIDDLSILLSIINEE